MGNKVTGRRVDNIECSQRLLHVRA